MELAWFILKFVLKAGRKKGGKEGREEGGKEGGWEEGKEVRVQMALRLKAPAHHQQEAKACPFKADLVAFPQ